VAQTVAWQIGNQVVRVTIRSQVRLGQAIPEQARPPDPAINCEEGPLRAGSFKDAPRGMCGLAEVNSIEIASQTVREPTGPIDLSFLPMALV